VHHSNPEFGPVYICKLDISDGFYRIPLEANSAPSLAVLLPAAPGEPPLVAIPLSLPMGWVELPPYFCAATETVADLANQRMPCRYAPPHRLEPTASTPTPIVSSEPSEGCPPKGPTTSMSFEPSKTSPPTEPSPPAPFEPSKDSSAGIPFAASLPEPLSHVTSRPLPNALSYVDVYMDDYICLAQGSHHH